nr:protein RNA-directed DNA methylation 3-like [Coffea arabica]
MAPSAKGKEKVIDGGKGSSGKRKRNIGGGDDGKTGGRKRKNRGVLQFFDDAAYEVDEDDASDDSFFDDDSLEDEFDTAAAAMQFQSEPSRAPFLPFVPKVEEPTEEELEKMLQERYKPGSTFVTYAEDNYESKRTVEMPEHCPSVKDPIIWKVKCMVGRERHSAFCLMQKYVDLQFLGKKLQIISAFTIDHVKGFIYIEAEKQCDINEACNGLCSIYSSRVAPVPKEDINHLFSVKNKSNGISEGMWARVKNGKYKGDLAQVVAVNSARKKVTVKLIPRIDLKALAEKFGRGITANRTANPAPRLISNSELEEFRPLIQCRRDRDTNKVFEVLDGMMLKDGYLYKKVSIDSLSFWGVTPTEDELLKFEPSRNEEYNDLEWLSQLYGEQKKKRPLFSDKGGGKGEGSSMPSLDTDFEVHDLVFFGRKDFGVVIGTEKDEIFKIIKEGSEGPVVVTIPRKELKNAAFDKKLFTALDQKMKNISINDRVRVLDGPMKDREGIVKKIYRGIIFLYNETVEENSGYICFKAQLCEKVELPGEARNEKGGEQETVVFGDFASSPKSPLSPKQSDQGRDGSRNFNRENNTMFSVGQSLRIRVGPLKGYLCRVLAIRRSDITVKLDSQHKILTVKCEHLAEVRAKSSGISLGEESDSLRPFDLLGTQDGSTDWLDGTAKATGGGNWNAEGFSTERSSWPAFPVSNSSLWTEAQSSNPLISVDEANKGHSSWEVKPTPSQGPSWGAAAAARQTSGDGGQVANWGNKEDSSKKGAFSTSFVGNASDSWGKALESVHQSTTQEPKEDSWGQAAENLSIKDDSSGSKSAWNASGVAPEKPTMGWGNANGGSDQPDANAWNKVTTSNTHETGNWQSTRKDGEGAGDESAWNQSARVIDGGSSWNKQDGESFGNKQIGGSSWNKPDGGSTSQSKQGGESSWSKLDGGSTSQSKQGGESSWSKLDGGSTSQSKPDGGSGTWSKQDGGSNSQGKLNGGSGSWSKLDGVSGSWSKPDGGSSSWSKPDRGSSSQSKQGGESSWSKPDGGSSSWSKPDGGFSSWSKPDGGSSSLSKQGGESSWSKPGGGSSSWSKPDGGSSSRSKQGGESSWSNPDGGSNSWSRPGGGSSSWSKPDRGSTWSKQGHGSSWSKPDGGSASWSKEVGSTENKGDTDQGGSWGRSESFGGARGSGGRSGRGGRGGRGQFGRGRSFGQGETSNWAKGNTDEHGFSGDASKGNHSSWNSGRADSWDKNVSTAGDKESGWGKPNASGDNGESKWRGATKDTGEWGGKSHTGWNGGRANDQNESSDWQKKDKSWYQKSDDSKMDVEAGKDDPWNSKKTSEGGSTSGWGQSKSGGATDAGGGSSSGWGQSKWGGAGDAGGGSSSGWGQSKWSGETEAGGKQNSWSSKSNWNSDNNFGSNEGQNDTFDNQGRGGNWRGGRGGRWGQDRDGFGRRGSERGDFEGRSDRGGFGGRGRSGRGGFGGRGRSDRGDFGDFGGRGGSDRGGFRGRGGFGGRGRGRRDDWNKNDSDQVKSYRYNMSNKDVDWKSSSGGGNWNDGDRDKGQWQSAYSGWVAAGGGDSAQAGGWNEGNDNAGGSWDDGVHGKGQWQSGNSGCAAVGGRDSAQAGGWNKGSNSAGGIGAQSSGWNHGAKDVASGDKPNSGKNGSCSNAGGWVSNNSGGNWQAGDTNQWQGAGSDGNKSKEPAESGDIEQAGGCTGGLDLSKDVSGSDTNSGCWNSQNNNWKTSNSSGGATSSSWNQPAMGKGEGAGTADAWGKAPASSWGQAKDGNDKGGW